MSSSSPWPSASQVSVMMPTWQSRFIRLSISEETFGHRERALVLSIVKNLSLLMFPGTILLSKVSASPYAIGVALAPVAGPSSASKS